MLSHWPHVAQQDEQLVAELVSENVAGTVHTGHKLSNKLRHIFVLMASSVRCCYAPRRLVAAHVASVKALLTASRKLSKTNTPPPGQRPPFIASLKTVLHRGSRSDRPR